MNALPIPARSISPLRQRLIENMTMRRFSATAPRERPAMRKHDTALPAFAPPQPEQLQKLRREHRIAILAAFALFETKQHARRVDIIRP